MYEDDKSDTSAKLESDVSDGMSTIKSTMGNSESSSQDEDDSSRGTSRVLGKASRIFFAVGTPISQPKYDPSDEHVRWLTETFDSEEVQQESDTFNIFQAVLDQCDIPNICASELRDFMIDFITKQQDIIEPIINNNLKARSLDLKKYVKWMVKGNMNGFDVTLKCISMMLRKAIVVLAEDYLWFTHKRDIKNIELVMILRKAGKFRGVRRMDGNLLECYLQYLKDWMESQSNKVDDEASSENTDQTDNTNVDVKNCSENTEMAQSIVESVVGEKKLGQGDLHKCDVQESVCHLNVKDIKSSDSEVLVPSSNAVIVGRSNILHNVSDTTWDESVTTVGTLNKSVDEHTNDQCTRDSREVTDAVVKSAIDKGDGESNGNGSTEQEYCEVTVEKKLPINPDVTDNQSTMEMSTHSMGTDKSSYKESDGATSESRETNMSLQYLTDEGKIINFIQYTIH